jgi:hypothetical protein
MNTLIIEDWKREKISLNGPASEFHIVECEAAIDFQFPDDFRNFYRICSGFTDWVMDSKMLSLWPLQMIREENFKPNFIAFADYNVNGSQIGYMRDRKGIYHDYNFEKFCDTFDEFINHWQLETGIYI